MKTYVLKRGTLYWNGTFGRRRWTSNQQDATRFEGDTAFQLVSDYVRRWRGTRLVHLRVRDGGAPRMLIVAEA